MYLSTSTSTEDFTEMYLSTFQVLYKLYLSTDVLKYKVLLPGSGYDRCCPMVLLFRRCLRVLSVRIELLSFMSTSPVDAESAASTHFISNLILPGDHNRFFISVSSPVQFVRGHDDIKTSNCFR